MEYRRGDIVYVRKGFQIMREIVFRLLLRLFILLHSRKNHYPLMFQLSAR